MTQTRTLRAGIIGTGFIGGVHAHAVRAAGGAVTRVSASTPDRSAEAAARLGLGEVDWRRVVDTLYEGGFDGVLSVEHEDPVWGGTEERSTPGSRSRTARCAR